ncbi:MAG TPA: hypothetical protein PKO06_20510, partial [Candidatus Ozemobacteraceae bacterium]|nr:hypothetical protein [Candidatus Ozemobacteraceae bacterium]
MSRIIAASRVACHVAFLFLLFISLPIIPLHASSFDQVWQQITRPFTSDLPVFTLTLRAQADAISAPALNEPRVGDTASGPASTPPSLQASELLLSRTGSDSWFLQLRSPWTNVEVRRTATETLLIVSDHLIVFSGRDLADCTNILNPTGALRRVFNQETSLQGLPFLLSLGSLEALNRLPGCDKLFVPIASDVWSIDGQATLTAVLSSATAAIDIRVQPGHRKLAALSHLSLSVSTQAVVPGPIPVGLHDQPVSRVELETMILHAVRRFCSIRFPSVELQQPPAVASTTGGV